ncbi:Nck-associated protein 1-like [Oopsacas minuta]|uniref:Nck-associated protein 1-like n=1 Tax=Oopsacas minuta TaxID=111878 RepID=A0AAV7KH72_9METZ|nr:Nck-associated protein 1-like [Oopsacas minuta]
MDLSLGKQKFAEKLLILNDRAKGILCRLHYIRRCLSDSKLRPAVLKDKLYEPALRHIRKTFPQIDSKHAFVATILAIDQDIVNSLTPLYYTFVDILEFRDETKNLIVSIFSNGMSFHAHLNFDISRALFELISDYVSIMIIMGRIEERKVICSVFNHVHDANRGQQEAFYPRLGQMLIEFEHPIRKMSEDFAPCAEQIVISIMTLRNVVYQLKISDPSMLRGLHALSISEAPSYILHPKHVNWPHNLSILSLDLITRWILLVFLVCSSAMTSRPEAIELCKKCIEYGYTVILHRNETILISVAITEQLLSTKDRFEKKKSVEISDAVNLCTQSSRIRRQEMRDYLRLSLQELGLLLTDSPGLLGPKLFILLMGLSMLRDEIIWMVKHAKSQVPKSKQKLQFSDFIDPHMPEMLFMICDFKALIYKHMQVVQNYYLKYLAGYDAAIMRDVVQGIQVAPEEESLLMTSFVENLVSLQDKTAGGGEEFEFSHIRLDWMRLQVSTSSKRSQMNLFENEALGINMNDTVIHSRAVDDLPKLIEECTDLSFFCFNRDYLEQDFRKCLSQGKMLKYAIAYPMVAAEYINSNHEMCPEERNHIGEISINKVNQYLDIIASETCGLLAVNIENRMKYNQQINSSNAANMYLRAHLEKTKKTEKLVARMEMVDPGSESHIFNRGEMSNEDLKYYQLVDICWTLNRFIQIEAWSHVFGPREYLTIYLEQNLLKYIHIALQADPASNKIRRPSEVASQLASLTSAIRSLELYLNMDLSRFLSKILLGQTQATDSKGEPTIASYYTDWYVQMLRDLSSQDVDSVFFSDERKSFISKSQSLKFETYASHSELQALAEIIGPYGFRLLRQKLLEDVSNQVKELKRLVIANKEVLVTIRNNLNRPEILNSHCKRIINIDETNNRLIQIGLILSFRNLSLNALHTILTTRNTFIIDCIRDIKDHYKQEDAVLSLELALASGFKTTLDPILINLLKVHVEGTQEDFEVWTLFMILIGVTIPEMGHKNVISFNTVLGAHQNNAHCIATSINTLTGCIFHKFGSTHPVDRMKEFLQLISNRLLRYCQEGDNAKEHPKYKDHVVILLSTIVKNSSYLTLDMLETYFPYALMRESYRNVVLGRKKRKGKTEESQY